MTGRPSPDVDALARRVPRREPGPDRSAVMRSAILEAAAAPLDAPSRAWSRGWVLGGLAAAAAAVCVWLVVRGGDSLAPLASTPAPPASRGEARAPAENAAGGAPAAVPHALEPGQPRAPDVASAGAALAAHAPEQLPDGVSSFVAERPLQVTRGTATITAPPDARFEVEVRGDEIRHVTVTAGWVVVASGHASTTVVPARYTWTPDAPAPRPTATDPPSPPPGSPPSAPPGSPPNPPPAVRPPSPPPAAMSPRMAELLAPPPPAERRAPVLPPLRAPRAPSDVSSDASNERRAPVFPPLRPGSDERRAPSLIAPASPGGDAGPPGAAPRSPAAAALPTSVEQDFRDGLRSLLAGDPGAAIPLLDRACQTPSASQDDSCYWAAVAWLRSGARPHARRAFAEVLTRWPGSTHISEAHIALGWLLLEIGDRAGARSHFAAAAADRLPSIRADALRGLTATQ